MRFCSLAHLLTREVEFSRVSLGAEELPHRQRRSEQRVREDGVDERLQTALPLRDEIPTFRKQSDRNGSLLQGVPSSPTPVLVF